MEARELAGSGHCSAEPPDADPHVLVVWQRRAGDRFPYADYGDIGSLPYRLPREGLMWMLPFTLLISMCVPPLPSVPDKFLPTT